MNKDQFLKIQQDEIRCEVARMWKMARDVATEIDRPTCREEAANMLAKFRKHSNPDIWEAMEGFEIRLMGNAEDELCRRWKLI